VWVGVWGQTCVRARVCARLCVKGMTICVRLYVRMIVCGCSVCVRICVQGVFTVCACVWRCVGTDMYVHIGCGFLQVWCVFAVWVRVYGKDVCADASLRRYVCEPTAIGGQLCVHMGLSGRNEKVMP
jgi:hypothetical protein